MKKEHFFQYRSTNYNELFKKLKNEELNGKTILLAGLNNQLRNHCLDEFSREVIAEPLTISLSDLVVPNEKESYDRMDAFFDTLPSDLEMLIFLDGEQLCGVYTAYTYSVVKYASPQEKYFIKKLEEVSAIKLISFEDTYSLDETLVRHAEAVITFNPPSSAIERFFWHLSRFRVNGSRLPTKRPV